MDYCKNCGKELNGTLFCTNCGAPVTPAEEPAPSDSADTYTSYNNDTDTPYNNNTDTPYNNDTDTPYNNDTDFSPAGDSPSGINGKKIGIIAVLVAAVIAACFLIFGGVNSSPKNVVKTAVKYTYNSPNIKKLSKLMPKKILDEIIDEGYDDKKDFYDEEQEILEDQRDDFEDEYGKNAKAKVKIKSVKDAKNDDLEDIQDRYEDEYDLKVKTAKTVKFKLMKSGEDNKDNEDLVATVVKIKGKWYMDSIYSAAFADDEE